MGKAIAYALVAAGACLTTVATAQFQAPAQSESSSGTPAASTPAVISQSRNSALSYQAPILAALHRRLDIVLSGTSLKQAMALIARQTGLRIDMDPRVTTTATVTVEAVNVPIYHVLEMIVHQPGTGMLMISPKAGGLLIEPYPTREVGNRTIYKGNNPPWSDAWEVAPNSTPTTRTVQAQTGIARNGSNPFAAGARASTSPAQEGPAAIVGGDAPASTPSGQSGVLPGAPGIPRDSQQPGAPAAQPPNAFSPYSPVPISPGPEYREGGQPQMGPGYPPAAIAEPMPNGFPGYALNGSLSVMVTALSEKSFVVTEPGIGPNREMGVYLTVYRIEGSAGSKGGEKIREVSRVFHKSANGGRAPVRGMMGPGGMPGNYNRGRGMGSGLGAQAPAIAPPAGVGLPPGYFPAQPSPDTPPAPAGKGTPNDSTTPPLPETNSGSGPPKAAVTPQDNNIADPTSGRTPAGDMLGADKRAEDPFNDD